MDYYILIDSEEFIISELLTDTNPGSPWILVPPKDRFYVRPKWSVSGSNFYEGANEAEINDQIRLFLEDLSVNLDVTEKQLFRVFFDGRGNLGNIIQERQAFYDHFYSQILVIKPDYQIPEKSPFYIPFKITLEVDADADHIVIPILYATSVSHAAINETTVIKSPTYNASTGRVDILVKSGDIVDITLRFV